MKQLELTFPIETSPLNSSRINKDTVQMATGQHEMQSVTGT
jgi:hypothetical protein